MPCYAANRVAESHHFYAAPAPGKNFDAAPAPARIARQNLVHMIMYDFYC
jgi:hypothetical protein